MKSLLDDRDKRKGEPHCVFQPSWDWTECCRKWFLIQKLNDIHKHPSRGKRRLVCKPEDYLRSSPSFYIGYMQGIYPVTRYPELQGIALTVLKIRVGSIVLP